MKKIDSLSPKPKLKINKELILKKLKLVKDPELGVNIVDLGLVYGVKIIKEKIIIKMTLTSPTCPLFSQFEDEIKKELKKIKGVKEILINLTFNPLWTPEKMSRYAKTILGRF